MDAARVAARGRPADVAAVSLQGVTAANLSSAAASLKAAAATGQVMVAVPLTTAAVDQLAADTGSTQWGGLGSTLATATSNPPIVRLIPETGLDPAKAVAATTALTQAVKTANKTAVIAWTAPCQSAPSQTTAPAGIDLIALDVPSGVAWDDLAKPLTAWTDYAATSGKRVIVTWTIDRATTPAMVQGLRAWLDVTAKGGRLSAETVTIAADANQGAVAAYNAAW